ncbi:hypothetical protein ACFSTI_00805 [Rhizorhabdus histidinilytica]
MSEVPAHRGLRLASVLSVIAQAEEDARHYDLLPGNRDRHAEAAQQADRCAETSRSLARRLIEDAFPG